jgi:protein ImuB
MQVWAAASNAIQSIAVDIGSTWARGQKSINNSANASHINNSWASALYPTWLLAEPLRLSMHQQRPYYQGLLTLLAGPQRLEAGWWAMPSVASMQPASPAALRDYFVARSDHSPLLWIYRERLGSADPMQPSVGWYLHGVFA